MRKEIDRRFDHIDGQIAERRREMLGHFDEIYRRLKHLEKTLSSQRCLVSFFMNFRA